MQEPICEIPERQRYSERGSNILKPYDIRSLEIKRQCFKIQIKKEKKGKCVNTCYFLALYLLFLKCNRITILVYLFLL